MKRERSWGQGGGGNRTRSQLAFDWRTFAARQLSQPRLPVSIVVGELIAEYFAPSARSSARVKATV